MVRIRRSKRWRGRTETGEEGSERGASIPAARRIKNKTLVDKLIMRNSPSQLGLLGFLPHHPRDLDIGIH